MRTIKGLIIKDLLQLKTYRKTLLIFIIIFVLTSTTQEKSTSVIGVLTLMLTLGFGMFGVASFSYDESAKADRYILTLPLTKKEVVLSKYVLISIATLIGNLLGMVISIIIALITYHEVPNISEILLLSSVSLLGIGIMEAIQIPCIYKWGAEKRRLLVFAIYAIFILLIGGVLFIGKDIFNEMPNSLEITIKILPIILILLVIIIYFISYKISCKIYNKKEV